MRRLLILDHYQHFAGVSRNQNQKGTSRNEDGNDGRSKCPAATPE
jgi:hypothetical protein